MAAKDTLTSDPPLLSIEALYATGFKGPSSSTVPFDIIEDCSVDESADKAPIEVELYCRNIFFKRGFTFIVSKNFGVEVEVEVVFRPLLLVLVDGTAGLSSSVIVVS